MVAKISVDDIRLISVIIPTWNRGELVVKAINSVLNQTYKNLEVLVCDDGSTDNTKELVSRINDKRVIWVDGSHSGLPSIARNRGLIMARGAYVAFIDSDDEWVPDKLEKQIKEMDAFGSSVSSTNAFRYIPGVGIKGEINKFLNKDLTVKDLLWSNKIVSSSALIKKSFLDDLGGFPEGGEFKVGEDYALWLKVALLANKISYLNEPLVIYRDEPSSSIRSLAKPSFFKNQYVYKHFFFWLFRFSFVSFCSLFVYFIAIKIYIFAKDFLYKTAKILGLVDKKY